MVALPQSDPLSVAITNARTKYRRGETAEPPGPGAVLVAIVRQVSESDYATKALWAADETAAGLLCAKYMGQGCQVGIAERLPGERVGAQAGSSAGTDRGTWAGTPEAPPC